MKRIFFFILCISKFLTASDTCVSIKRTTEDIIKKHLNKICTRCTRGAELVQLNAQRCQELVKPEYLQEVVYRALRGGHHLTKKEPLKFDDPSTYQRLHGYPPVISTQGEELPDQMKIDIQGLYDELQHNK